MARCNNIMTTGRYYLFGLYPRSLTSVAFPWLTNSSPSTTSITAEIVLTVGIHLYNRTLTCFPDKVTKLVSCTPQPYKIAGILNGNRALNFLAWVYLDSPCTHKFIMEFNGMKSLNGKCFSTFPSHELWCHITCGIQWMPSFGKY